jgi:hypothetical protein
VFRSRRVIKVELPELGQLPVPDPDSLKRDPQGVKSVVEAALRILDDREAWDRDAFFADPEMKSLVELVPDEEGRRAFQAGFGAGFALGMAEQQLLGWKRPAGSVDARTWSGVAWMWTNITDRFPAPEHGQLVAFAVVCGLFEWAALPNMRESGGPAYGRALLLSRVALMRHCETVLLSR